MKYCLPSPFIIKATSCLYPIPAPPVKIDGSLIIDAVCFSLNLSKLNLLSPCRARDLAEARFIAYHFMRKRMPLASLKNIAQLFKRDHSTIIYGLQTYSDLYETSFDFKEKSKLVAERLKVVAISEQID